MSRTLMVIGLAVMVGCACFAEAAGVPPVADTKTPSPAVGYGAIGQGGNHECSPKNPKACNVAPANPYYRGCEKEDHCHHVGRKLLEEEIQDFRLQTTIVGGDCGIRLHIFQDAFITIE
ncbi:hypothetical protein POTOM_058551 [Populus tomentosa]|uniref:Uncharacterized protein n=1 Tax=Populus tomentosa TaxID=118781 RepID=A0A8X7XX70_POPTO|nr:hypothetical protein POTOM_058551 [Populus tomentosa]